MFGGSWRKVAVEKNIVTCKGGWREGKRSKREGMK